MSENLTLLETAERLRNIAFSWYSQEKHDIPDKVDVTILYLLSSLYNIIEHLKYQSDEK